MTHLLVLQQLHQILQLKCAYILVLTDWELENEASENYAVDNDTETQPAIDVINFEMKTKKTLKT